MKRNSKKGFTLIELLAVIVILVIIALITVPLILNVIENTKKQAFLDSAYGILASTDLSYLKANEQLDKIEYPMHYTFLNGKLQENEIPLNYKGENPEKGDIILYKNGHVYMILWNGKYCVEKEANDSNIKFKDYGKYNCTLPENRDTEGPEITITGNNKEILKGKDFDVFKNNLYTVIDKGTGVEKVEATLNGKSITNTKELSVGKYTITFTAYDYFENSSSASCDIQIVDPDYVDRSGANIPDLLQNMIPIKYNGENWVYANVKENWYNYDSKEWANAVVLNSGVKKSVGDTIAESEVALWYVWIPRYKYQLFNAKNESKPEQLINVQFENKIETTGTVTCTTASNGVETCTNAENGNWYTHPAFTLGTQQLTGIWVGKFEVSTSDATCNSNVNSTNCNKELPVIIKSGIASWRFATVSNFYQSIKTMSNTYSITDGDSHMMKNNEWGAVAYLKQSKYGLGMTDIERNSNSSYVTGGGTGTAYKTEDNIKQSTTGNIYGVYDMSGGAYEYVMGNMVNSSGSFYSSNTKFTETPDSKYYDIYSYNTYSSTHARGHLGDATKETLKNFGNSPGTWYRGRSHFVINAGSWFGRGGAYGLSESGIFCFAGINGDSYNGYSTRAVLTHK